MLRKASVALWLTLAGRASADQALVMEQKGLQASQEDLWMKKSSR